MPFSRIVVLAFFIDRGGWHGEHLPEGSRVQIGAVIALIRVHLPIPVVVFRLQRDVRSELRQAVVRELVLELHETSGQGRNRVIEGNEQEALPHLRADLG